MADATDLPSDPKRWLDELSRDYGSLRRRIVSYLCRKFGLDLARAEDHADEAVEHAVANIDQYNGSRPLLAWLCGIAHHLYVDHLKSAEYRRTTASTDDIAESLAGPSSEEPEKAFRRRRLAACLRNEIAKLPPLHRRAILLCRLDGYEQKEAAQKLGVSIRRLRQVLYEGMVHLRGSRAVKALGDDYLKSGKPGARKSRTGGND